MERRLKNRIVTDLKEKIVLVAGPRQTGKTTLTKTLIPDAVYLNYDDSDDRYVIEKKAWDPSSPLVILNEIHKMVEWKRWLKGIYDTRGIPPQLIVTGSAKLDTYRKVGDSLAGRYFSYRLHPFDIKEVSGEIAPNDAFTRILNVSGFPEPFLKNDPDFYGTWARTHQDIILRQDLVDLERMTDIQSIERLTDLLSRRVGSTVSYANLANDLQRDPKTVKKWISYLESLHIIFSIVPYSKKIARAHLREPKYYFYNTASVKGDNGTKFENLVACALLKEVHWHQDTRGSSYDLCFLRSKDGKEIDFVIIYNDTPIHMIECKWSDSKISPSFRYFQQFYPSTPGVQLIGTGLPKDLYFLEPNLKICRAPEWLQHIPI